MLKAALTLFFKLCHKLLLLWWTFPSLLLPNSFFSGVLCGYCGAAVHYLPQGSSVLQTSLLSGATCRYGKKTKGWKSSFCAEFSFFLSFQSGLHVQFWSWSSRFCFGSHWQRGPGRAHKDTMCTQCSTIKGRQIQFAWLWEKRTKIDLIWSLSGNEFASAELAALQKYLSATATLMELDRISTYHAYWC